jgi:WD40 repeat protein
MIRRFDGRTGAALGRTDTEASVYTVAFSRDGTRFATGGEDGVARVWMTSGGPEVAMLRGQRTRVYDIGFGPEPERVVAAGGDGVVRLWNAEPTVTIKVPGFASLVDLSPDGGTLLTSSDDGAVRLWNATSGERLAGLPGEEGPVVGEFAPVSGRVLVAGAGPTVRLWDGAQEETIVRLDDNRLDVAAANFDMPEERIVYVDTAGRIIVRELASGHEVKLNGGPEAVYDAQFSADGARVAIHPEDGILRVWRIDRPDRPERVLRGHRGNINGLAYGRDGRIATAGADGTVRIWPAQGSRALVLSGHTQEVTGVAWSADQATVMTTSLDGTLRVWNSRTGEPMARLVTSDVGLWHLAVSRDGKIAYLDENGVVRIFRCGVCGGLDEVAALARSRHPRQLSAEERARYQVD